MASRDPARPNVVLVVSDDQGAWALGAAGNDEVITPHLDALAATGTLCENFFCVSPVCSPARASIYTGAIPSRHGVHDWICRRHVGADAADFLAGQSLFTDRLAGAGYRCGLSGKWHLGANDVPRPGFVHWFAHQQGGGPYFDAPVVRDGELTTQAGYVTQAFTDDAVAFVRDEAARPEPFFLALQYTAPHSPWSDHPAEFVDLYRDCAFSTMPDEPPHPWLRWSPDGTPGARGSSLEVSRTGYYAAITGMDHGIGQVVAELEAAGLRDSTLIVFTSDNGFNCGHHGVWGKGNGTFPLNMYDSSVKVPAVFSQPGRVRPAARDRTLLSHYDLGATILEWVGLSPVSGGGTSPGRSFASVLRGDTAGARERLVVFDEYGPTRMIRTADWKYVWRGDDGPAELYALDDDPQERTNLIDTAGLRSRTRDLHGELVDWFAAYHEPAHDGITLPVTGMGQIDLVTRTENAFRPLNRDPS